MKKDKITAVEKFLLFNFNNELCLQLMKSKKNAVDSTEDLTLLRMAEHIKQFDNDSYLERKQS